MARSSGRLERLFERILQADYYRYEQVQVAIRGRTYQAVSKMGLPGWPDVDPAQLLMAEKVELSTDARVVCLGNGGGLSAVVACDLAPDGEVWAATPDYVAYEGGKRAAELNGARNLHFLFSDDLYALEEQPFDAVLMGLPKDRERADRLLVRAHQLLRVGGWVYLVGAKRAGVKGGGRRLEQVFGPVQVVAYRRGQRLLRAQKTAAEVPGSALPAGGVPAERRLRIRSRGKEYAVLTRPGVFSWRSLDEGTAALLEAMQVGRTETVLDLGCGWGVLGLVAAGLAPEGHIYLVDSDVAAVECAAGTIALNQVGNATVRAGDVVSAVRDASFDVVITNPPFHSGVETELVTPLAFIAGSAQVLRPGGRLYLVANRFIPYEPYLQRLFSPVRVVWADGRFKVLEAIRLAETLPRV